MIGPSRSQKGQKNALDYCELGKKKKKRGFFRNLKKNLKKKTKENCPQM